MDRGKKGKHLHSNGHWVIVLSLANLSRRLGREDWGWADALPIFAVSVGLHC